MKFFTPSCSYRFLRFSLTFSASTFLLLSKIWSDRDAVGSAPVEAMSPAILLMSSDSSPTLLPAWRDAEMASKIASEVFAPVISILSKQATDPEGI